MFNTDNELITYSLDLWANYIETGDICLSANDAANQNKKVKALSIEQMKLVIRLRELSKLYGREY